MRVWLGLHYSLFITLSTRRAGRGPPAHPSPAERSIGDVLQELGLGTARQPGGPGEGSIPAKPAPPRPALCWGLPAGARANDRSLGLTQLSSNGLPGGQLLLPLRLPEELRDEICEKLLEVTSKLKVRI